MKYCPLCLHLHVHRSPRKRLADLLARLVLHHRMFCERCGGRFYFPMWL
jgi:ribosomal protein L33